MKQFAADIVAFMDAMNVKDATIVGHSMGSFVAQHVAAQVPERVNKLVLIGSATKIRNNVVTDLQREINGLTDPLSEKFVRDFQTGVAFQPLPSEFLNRVSNASLRLYAPSTSAPAY